MRSAVSAAATDRETIDKRNDEPVLDFLDAKQKILTEQVESTVAHRTCGCKIDQKVLEAAADMVEASTGSYDNLASIIPCSWMTQPEIGASTLWGALLPAYQSPEPAKSQNHASRQDDDGIEHVIIRSEASPVTRLLGSGVRYLSLAVHRHARPGHPCVVAVRMSNQDGESLFYDIRNVMAQIKGFLDSHPREVVVLSFFQDMSPNFGDYPNLLDALELDVMTLLNFGRKMLHDQSVKADHTIEYLQSHGTQLIYFFGGQERVLLPRVLSVSPITMGSTGHSGFLTPRDQGSARRISKSDANLEPWSDANSWVQGWTKLLSTIVEKALEEYGAHEDDVLAALACYVPPPFFLSIHPDSSDAESDAFKRSSRRTHRRDKNSRNEIGQQGIPQPVSVQISDVDKVLYLRGFERSLHTFLANLYARTPPLGQKRLSLMDSSLFKAPPSSRERVSNSSIINGNDSTTPPPNKHIPHLEAVPKVETVKPLNATAVTGTLDVPRNSNSRPSRIARSSLNQWLMDNLWTDHPLPHSRLLSCCHPPIPSPAFADVRGLKVRVLRPSTGHSRPQLSEGASRSHLASSVNDHERSQTGRQRFDENHIPHWNNKAALMTIPPKERNVLNKKEAATAIYRHVHRSNAEIDGVEVVKERFIEEHRKCAIWNVDYRMGTWGQTTIPHSKGRRVHLGNHVTTTKVDKKGTNMLSTDVIQDTKRFCDRYSGVQPHTMPFLVFTKQDAHWLMDVENHDVGINKERGANQKKSFKNRLKNLRRNSNGTDAAAGGHQNTTASPSQGYQSKLGDLSMDVVSVHHWIACLLTHPGNELHICTLDDYCPRAILTSGLAGISIDWIDEEANTLITLFNFCDRMNHRGRTRSTAHEEVQRRAKWVSV